MNINLKMEKGYIYKIVINDMIYVGSSVNINRRKSEHNGSLNNKHNKKHNNKLYQKCREANVNNIELILIEEYEFTDNIQLRQREQYYIDTMKADLNMDRAYVSEEENIDYGKIYREKKKDKLSEKRKLYYEKNIDKINEKKKLYYEENKDKMREKDKNYYEKNKDKVNERQKIYNDKNKEKQNETHKIYYEKNKEKILKKLAEKVECDICGCLSTKGHLPRHKKTSKCMSFIKNNIN